MPPSSTGAPAAELYRPMSPYGAGTGSETSGTVPTESRVLIIMTGGTICMTHSTNGFIPVRGFLDACLAPRPSFNDGFHLPDVDAIDAKGRPVLLPSLRTPVSRYGRHIRYAVLEFDELLDSSSVDARGWGQIAHTVHLNYTAFDAFVVLHGTDSLAYTSSALSFMLQNLGKPVIFTGSQAPMLELQNDATDNMLGSLIIAGHFMIPEVCLFFNYKLFRGNRAVKVSADEFAAFASPNFPPLATITSSKTQVAWNLVHRPTQIKSFSVQTNLDTAHVACLRIFPGIKPEMVEAVLRVSGLRGLVLETFGAGNAPKGPDSVMTRIFADAVLQRGIVIVSVTQCMSGSVSPLYEPAVVLGRAGVIAGCDLTTEAALAKLSYLLALPGLTVPEVTRQMSVALVGEMTTPAEITFAHPGDGEPSRQANLARLRHAIAAGDLVKIDEIMKYEIDWLLNEADATGNTPMHLAAGGPNLEILRRLLLNGASVHLRNRAGHTPLFIAAEAGRKRHVMLLRISGAHLHPNEASVARLHAQRDPSVWTAAGI